VEELARLFLLLDRRQHEREAEQHLVHALVLAVLGGADERLDRLEQHSLGLVVIALLLRQQRAALRLRQLVDLLLERVLLVERRALLLGVELAETEHEVRLLRIIVLSHLDETLHLADLRVHQLLDLLRLLFAELIHRQCGPGFFLLRRRRVRLGQAGLLGLYLGLLLRELTLAAIGRLGLGRPRCERDEKHSRQREHAPEDHPRGPELTGHDFSTYS
jgi:hypothetical protein